MRQVPSVPNTSGFSHGTGSVVINSEAWIPDTLRFASVAHEVGNDALPFAFPLVSSAGDWRKPEMKFVIPDLVSDRRERRVSGIHALPQVTSKRIQKDPNEVMQLKGIA